MAKFCSECGTATEAAKFCPECGNPTGDEGNAPVSATAPGTATDEEREVWRGAPDSLLSPVASRTTSYVLTTERLRAYPGRNV
jgi:hypothetical protein